MKLANTFTILLVVTAITTLTSCTSSTKSPEITPEEARAIAKEAYTFGFPMVDNYRIQHSYYVARDNTEYKGPYNTIINMPRVYTPADKTVQTPNSDTPYSMLGLDLRSEPIVITVPKIEKDRYYSIQLIDLYTHNFDYIGSRTTGNDSGSYMIAGPEWKGETPKGILKMIRSETAIAGAIFRTQLFDPADLENVKKVQQGYKVQPLSAFLGQPAPPAAPAIEFRAPLSSVEERSSLEFFDVVNFLLQFCPTNETEKELMERFAKIGVGAGKKFDSTSFSPEIKEAIKQGIGDSWAELADLKKKIDAKELTSGDMFGTRAFLKNNYPFRMAAAVLGIYGNSKDEAMYPVYALDSAGQPLSGTNRYTVHFPPGQLPPVNGFWSLTMYEMPSSLLVENSINRYLLNSPMLPHFKKDKDGGLTFYVQHESPGKDKEANWLPAPKGPFAVVMRLYWPKAEAANGKWTAPPLIRTG